MNCPKCQRRMSKSKTQRDGKYVTRYLKCSTCNTTLHARFLPEVLVETIEVQTCTKSLLNLPPEAPLCPSTAVPSLEH